MSIIHQYTGGTFPRGDVPLKRTERHRCRTLASVPIERFDGYLDERRRRYLDWTDLTLLWIAIQDDPVAAAYGETAAPDFADFRVAQVLDQTPLRIHVPGYDVPIRFTPRATPPAPSPAPEHRRGKKRGRRR